MRKFICIITFILVASRASAQTSKTLPKGNLFIIGGGDRTTELMRQLVATAALQPNDHIAILTMAGSEPDSSFFYIKQDFEPVCKNTLAYLNFTPDKTNDKTWLDSVLHAKLIFITGGDQTRFMKVVLHTPVYDAIHTAYNNGSTIAGTSAGAAVMSKYMITGNQLLGDTEYHATFDRLWNKNIEFEEGLGLLDSIIIDQHFVVRSRYNRLFSALAAFPTFTCIGIDEATAIIVHHNQIKVAGESQVLVLSDPKQLSFKKDTLIKFSDVHLSIYTAGDSFYVK